MRNPSLDLQQREVLFDARTDDRPPHPRQEDRERGAEPALDQGSGAAPINSNVTAYYNDLKTGVINGAIVWGEAAGTFKFGEVAPYMLRAGLGAVISFEITVNKDVWGRLPEVVKSTLREVGNGYGDAMAKLVAVSSVDGLAKAKLLCALSQPS